jgi:hypothetical protein
LNGIGNVTGNGLRPLYLGFEEVVGLVIIEHELAQEFALLDQRNKGNGLDAFTQDNGLERTQIVRLSNIGDQHRLWLAFIGGPRLMTLDLFLIAGRKAA